MDQREADFVRRVNLDLPEGVDWKQGAVTYLRELVSDGGADAEWYHLVKPFVGGPDFSTFWVDVFYFLDLVHRCDLPARSVVLDVGCGPGWTVHWLAKLGFDVTGVDISTELLAIAERRMQSDPFPPFRNAPFAYQLAVHDIEDTPVGLPRKAQLAVLESTLHHFFNPVAALRNVRADLDDMGLLAVIEGAAPPPGSTWHRDNVELMERYHTIERPYTREQLYEMLELAGLPFVEFYRPLNGLYHQQVDGIAEVARELAWDETANVFIAAANREALARIHPTTRSIREQRDTPRFLDGVFGAEQRRDGTHFRWSAPRSLLVFDGDGPHRLMVHALGLDRRGEQTVRALVDGKVAAKVVLTGRQPHGVIEVSVPARTRIELHSDRAFSPSWDGGTDVRVLSFQVDDPA